MYFTWLECSETLNVAYFTCLEGSGRLNLSYFTCLEGSGRFNLSYITRLEGSGRLNLSFFYVSGRLSQVLGGRGGSNPCSLLYFGSKVVKKLVILMVF